MQSHDVSYVVKSVDKEGDHISILSFNVLAETFDWKCELGRSCQKKAFNCGRTNFELGQQRRRQMTFAQLKESRLSPKEDADEADEADSN